ncbi:ArnT family glycosyltransferase [Deminuibacter soli]|uniref:Glycosyltransferase family 39 protein n=1 Tax=Deminuibacter soli TaxID=2291815 RepID=A0A3E1NED6_9BACT|nr:glycosyltransferase family 39 protein [Deminuibacter soli]RFM26138.1 glycosyltransferase family 39 protein [Deminuibacter soli]
MGEDRSKKQWLLLTGILTFLLLVNLGATPIYILDEAKNAQCAREMLQRGDWVVPTFNGALRTDKPPLHYFFMMAAYSIFGYTAFAARFFSALAGIATMLVTYGYTKRHSNAFTALCAALVLVASPHYLFEFRLSVPDPYLILFITLGLFSAYTWIEENNSKQLYIAAIAFALATLAKGPVALALPGLCIGSWVIIKKRWAPLRTWHLVPAFILLCCIALPWYIAVFRATDGAWTKGFFIDHNLNRFADPQEGHGGFFLLPLLFVTVGLLPFMSFAGELVKKGHTVFNSSLPQFGGIVFAVFVIFFSISSTKLPNYPMPCYPFAAVMIGHFIAALLTGEISSRKYPVYIIAVFLAIVPVAGYLAIRSEPAAASVSSVALLLLVVPVGFIVWLIIKQRNATWTQLVKALAVAFFAFNMLGLHIVYPVLYRQNPVSKTLALVQHQPVLSYQLYNPGYNFYMPGVIPRYHTIDSLRKALEANPSALVISRKEFFDSLQLHLHLEIKAEAHDIFESPTTVILQQHATP